MSKAKLKRENKRQLGQYFTPTEIAQKIVDQLPLKADSVVLEPSAGDGAFVLPLIRALYELQTGSHLERIERILTRNLFAIEIDRDAHASLVQRIRDEFGILPDQHNIQHSDFFAHYVLDYQSQETLFSRPVQFDFIIGNPPF